MDKFIETYGERPDGHGGLPTMATRAQDTWDALRAAYEIGKSEWPSRAADEYEEAMHELDRHGIPRTDGLADNELTLSLKGRMLRFLVRMTSNANVTGPCAGTGG